MEPFTSDFESPQNRLQHYAPHDFWVSVSARRFFAFCSEVSAQRLELLLSSLMV